MRFFISVLSVIAVIVLAAAANSGVVTAQSEPAAPAGLQVANGPNPGEASVTWNAVSGVSTYRVGWLAVEDFNAHSANEVWRSYFRYSDVTANSAWTVDRLTPGLQYYFIVGRRYDNGAIGWSGWETFALDAADAACPTDGQPQTGTIGSASVGGDYDADNDGLIEIRNLTQLDAIRYDLDGDGSAEDGQYAAAFPNAQAGMGCPSSGCVGYELVNDLDYGTELSAQGWSPIGIKDDRTDNNFNAVFDGNGHTISNLYINRTSTRGVGLFGVTGADSAIQRVGLVSVAVTGGNDVGSLIGSNFGSVNNSYATGTVSGAGDDGDAGGLIGENINGTVTDSYAAVSVSGQGSGVGGLLGIMLGGDASILRSYATGPVSCADSFCGGLVGYVGPGYADGEVTIPGSGSITASYATGNVSVRGHERTLRTGGLVGILAGGSIAASYATGDVNAIHWITHTSRDNNYVGGLVGENTGAITAGYATGKVHGSHGVGASTYAGGLVGRNAGTIASSYATGRTTGSSIGYSHSSLVDVRIGGFVAFSGGSTVASYWDTETSEVSNSHGDAIGLTTAELQAPTEAIGIYAGWNPSWWDFGTSSQYPVLKAGGLSVAAQR